MPPIKIAPRFHQRLMRPQDMGALSAIAGRPARFAIAGAAGQPARFNYGEK